MSLNALLSIIPISAVPGLIPAARPIRRLFRKPEYRFFNYVRNKATRIEEFDGDGVYIVWALGYLRSAKNVNLINQDSGLNIESKALSKLLGDSIFFIRPEDLKYLDQIEDQVAITQYCLSKAIREMGFDSPPFEIDVAMLREALGMIDKFMRNMDENSLVLIRVGG